MRFTKIWIAAFVVLLLIARIIVIIDLLPPKFGYSEKEKHYKAIQTIAGDLPVVFTGSFQRPSLYMFFTKQDASVLSDVHNRQTQFDIWQKELDYHGKPVFIYSPWFARAEEFKVNEQTFYGYKTDNFQSVNRLKIEYSLTKRDIKAGDILDIHFKIHNPTGYDIDFDHYDFPVSILIVYKVNRTINLSAGEMNEEINIIKSGESLSRNIKTVVPELQAGKYLFALTLSNTVATSKNSDYVSVKIIETEYP